MFTLEERKPVVPKCGMDALVYLAYINSDAGINRQQRVQNPQIFADKILEEIAEIFEINIVEIKSKSRKTEYVILRQIFCYVCKKTTKLTWLEIAGKLGGRDHSTAIHSVESVRDHIKTNDIKFISYWNWYRKQSKIWGMMPLTVKS